MLGLLAHKRAGGTVARRRGCRLTSPNVVFGAETHVVWDKFAELLRRRDAQDPDARPTASCCSPTTSSRRSTRTRSPSAPCSARRYIGEADPIEEINDLLVRIKEEKGWDIPLHVDGASGGFIAPFADPEMLWDFRLEQVASINASGHKYGLVYPGVGWLIFRDRIEASRGPRVQRQLPGRGAADLHVQLLARLAR